MKPTSLPLTILLIILLLVAAFAMFQVDGSASESERELILFCHSDGRCTTAAGAFWAEVDSVEAAKFFDAPDVALPEEGS